MRRTDRERARHGRRPRRRWDRDVRIGTLIEVEVTGLGHRGDGLASDPDGGTLYVPKSLPGDRLRVRTGAPKGGGRSATIVDVLRPGSGRAEPPCPHFAQCGGCALQHLADDDYIGWKCARLRRALQRGGFAGAKLAPAIRVPPEARRRATFTAVRPAGAEAPVRLGFASPRSHEIVDLSVCPVLEPPLVRLIGDLRGLLTETLQPGGRIRIAVNRLDGGLDVVFDWPEPPSLDLRERWAEFAATARLARLSWRSEPTRPAEPVAARSPAVVVHAGTAVVVPPGGFLQATQRGEAALTEAVLAATAEAQSVADLFSGLGGFALALAGAGKGVHAVDADGPAIEALAAATRGNARVTTERRDLFARPLDAANLGRFDAVVFDPPRAGARAQAEALAQSSVPVVVAISCNPNTFVRDAGILAAAGYRLETVRPVDQFLWSPHLELVAVFTR